MFNAGFWYQFKDYNIQPEMGRGEPISNSNQTDSTFKAFVNWRYLINNWRFELLSGYVKDDLVYSKDGELVNEIGSNRSLNSLYVNRMLGQLSFEVGLRYNYLKGRSYKFGENKKEHEWGASLTSTLSQKRNTLSLILNKEWNSLTNPPLMVSISDYYNLINDKVNVRAKLSTHYRRPTFNDRYWEFGGNPDLEAERGVNGEVGVSYIFLNTSNKKVEFEGTVYLADNSETIMWIPAGGSSKAVNTGKTKSYGYETKVTYNAKFNSSHLDVALLYGYGKHIFNDKDALNYKQDLYYKPQHLVRAWVTYGLPQFDMTLNNSFQSSSTTPDGFKVKSVLLTDFVLSAQPVRKYSGLSLMLKVENVFNVNYQLVYKYAQPRRNYSLGLSLIL